MWYLSTMRIAIDIIFIGYQRCWYLAVIIRSYSFHKSTKTRRMLSGWRSLMSGLTSLWMLSRCWLVQLSCQSQSSEVHYPCFMQKHGLLPSVMFGSLNWRMSFDKLKNVHNKRREVTEVSAHPWLLWIRMSLTFLSQHAASFRKTPTSNRERKKLSTSIQCWHLP